LGRQNISYWSDQQIHAGEDWLKKIENALDQASVFVIVVSPDFAVSDWAMYEMGYAISRSKETGAKIVPVIISDGKVPDLLLRFQWIDARAMKPDEFAKQVKNIITKKGGSMSNRCPRCHGKGKVWHSAIFDLSNVSNGYWEECPRCTGSGEVAEDEDEDEND
jgi:hypothetical protein